MSPFGMLIVVAKAPRGSAGSVQLSHVAKGPSQPARGLRGIGSQAVGP